MGNIQDNTEILILNFKFETSLPVLCIEWPEKIEHIKELGFVKIAFKISLKTC